MEAAALAPGGDVHGRIRVRPGGSAANAAVWATAEGAATRLYGRVGDDLAGRLVTEAVAGWGVDAALAVDPEAPTGSVLVVHDAGDRSMVVERGANGRLSPEDLPADLEAGAVIVSGYTLVSEGSMEAGRAALQRARAPIVAVDAASWPLVDAFGVDRFFEVTGRANMLLANGREAEVLSGCAPGAAAAKELQRRDSIACVKLGAEGAVAGWDGRMV
ncbi:MAG: carbohydrate kinase family protein, partial [Actinomycetota bacterium]